MAKAISYGVLKEPALLEYEGIKVKKWEGGATPKLEI